MVFRVAAEARRFLDTEDLIVSGVVRAKIGYDCFAQARAVDQRTESSELITPRREARNQRVRARVVLWRGSRGAMGVRPEELQRNSIGCIAQRSNCVESRARAIADARLEIVLVEHRVMVSTSYLFVSAGRYDQRRRPGASRRTRDVAR
jgi:hypothetical protein